MSGLVDCGRDVGLLGGATATKAIAVAGAGVCFGCGRTTKLRAFALAVSHLGHVLFFLCFSSLFFHQTYAGARKKNKMPKEKKNTGSVSQTT